MELLKTETKFKLEIIDGEGMHVLSTQQQSLYLCLLFPHSISSSLL